MTLPILSFLLSSLAFATDDLPSYATVIPLDPARGTVEARAIIRPRYDGTYFLSVSANEISLKMTSLRPARAHALCAYHGYDAASRFSEFVAWDKARLVSTPFRGIYQVAIKDPGAAEPYLANVDSILGPWHSAVFDGIECVKFSQTH